MIIETQKELDQFCQTLSAQKFITIDTEFLREKTYYPKLCLIQLSTPEKDARIVDPLDTYIDLEPLYDLLANKDVIKVFHAARQDLEIFFNLTGKIPAPIFDTQIAAMVCGYGDSIGYENLVKNITGNALDKSSQFTNWAHRPLSDKQLNYALGDVTHLCDIYRHLSDKLAEQGRTEWVDQEEAILLDPDTYTNKPEDMWKKVKIRSPKPITLAILRELAGWREQEAQRRNLPRPWVLRDETLADLASQAPSRIEDLKKIRNIPGDVTKHNLGKTLIKLIETGKKCPKEEWPRLIKKQPLKPHLNAILDVLKLLLKIQAAHEGVATKLIASSADLERLATEDIDINSDHNLHPLKGWRYEIFGRDALALKNGELSIGLKDGKIVKFDMR